jgi:hypothetical protein
VHPCFNLVNEEILTKVLINFIPRRATQHRTLCDDNNNNNKLQLGYHPVVVVILHVHKYGKKVIRKKVTRKEKK